MTTRVALAQFASVEAPQANVESMASAIRSAAEAGVDIIAFHELATTNYFCYERRNADRFALAEPLDGPSVESIASAADAHNVHVILPMYEQAGQHLYNTVALIEPRRGVVESYRKAHIPNMGAHGSEPGAEETFYFQPGRTGFKVWQSSLGVKIGVLVCFDRHFPEASRLYSEQGADILFAPTASYRRFITETMWEAELRTMAFQTGMYVAGINKIGPVIGVDRGATYPGHSMLIDPEGRVIAAADSEPGLLLADIDAGAADEAKGRMGYSAARRPDLYGALVSSPHQATAEASPR